MIIILGISALLISGINFYTALKEKNVHAVLGWLSCFVLILCDVLIVIF